MLTVLFTFGSRVQLLTTDCERYSLALMWSNFDEALTVRMFSYWCYWEGKRSLRKPRGDMDTAATVSVL